MSAQHSPGRLALSKAKHMGGEYIVATVADERGDRALVIHSDAGDCSHDDENARRLVATWNACAGIPTDVLEAMPDGPAALLPMYAQLEAQRDTLLAAARTMSAALDDLIAKKPALAGVMSGSTTMGNQRVEFRAVIKQVEAAL